MNYLERKELLESQGWHCMVKVGNSVTFTKGNLFGLYVELDCTNGNYKVWSASPQDDLDKHLPKLKRSNKRK